MAANVTFSILARDLASATLNKVGGAADKTGKKVKTFGAVSATAGVIASAALLKFGKDSIKAFTEAEDAQLRLQDAFDRFPKIADSNVQAVNDIASALQNKTKADDEAVKSGAAVLAQFVDSGEQLEQLLPLLVDYAQKTGKDIPTAAKTLGKAFLGNTRALKELGINYKTTGDRAKDTANITDLLRQKVGGFAEKEGKTAAGQAAILQHQFEELQETVGSALVPVMTKLVSTFVNMDPALQKIVLGLGALSIAALIVIPRLAAINAGLATMGTSAAGAGKGLGIAGLAVAGLGETVSYTRNIFKIWGDETQSFGEKNLNSLKSFIGATSLGMIDLGQSSNKTKGSLNDLYSIGLKVAQGLIDQTNPALKALSDAAGGAAGKLDFLNDKMRTVTETNITFKNAVANWTTQVRDAAKTGDKFTHSLSAENQTGRDNISALVDMTEAASAHGQAVLDRTKSVDKASAAVRADRKALLDAAEAAGFNRKKVAELVDLYLKVPKNVSTKIKAEVSGLSQVLTLSNFLTTWNGVRVNIPVSAITARQYGGPVTAGHAYLVGERRPELFIPNQSGRIQPSVPSGGSGPMRLHPADIRALGEVMGRVVLAGLGAANVRSARATDLYARAG